MEYVPAIFLKGKKKTIFLYVINLGTVYSTADGVEFEGNESERERTIQILRSGLHKEHHRFLVALSVLSGV